jgi:hypothetical protein
MITPPIGLSPSGEGGVGFGAVICEPQGGTTFPKFRGQEVVGSSVDGVGTFNREASRGRFISFAAEHHAGKGACVLPLIED